MIHSRVTPHPMTRTPLRLTKIPKAVSIVNNISSPSDIKKSKPALPDKHVINPHYKPSKIPSSKLNPIIPAKTYGMSSLNSLKVDTLNVAQQLPIKHPKNVTERSKKLLDTIGEPQRRVNHNPNYYQ